MNIVETNSKFQKVLDKFNFSNSNLDFSLKNINIDLIDCNINFYQKCQQTLQIVNTLFDFILTQ